MARDTPGGEDPSEEVVFRLWRYSYILVSAVREILGVKLLREATRFPRAPSQFHLLRLVQKYEEIKAAWRSYHEPRIVRPWRAGAGIELLGSVR
ncbi:MAG: hypothetical protein WBE26_18145 [Phycisphaerae bacterium]